MPAYLVGDGLSHAYALGSDDLLDERLHVRLDGHNLHRLLGRTIQRDLGDGPAAGVQNVLPALTNLSICWSLASGDAYHASVQRPEQDNIVQRPARGFRCPPAGAQDGRVADQACCRSPPGP